MDFEKIETAIMDGVQNFHEYENGGEPMPAKKEACIYAAVSLLISIAQSLDTIARTAQKLSDQLDAEMATKD